MKQVFVDTNYFLRFIVKDNAKQFLVAKKLFNQAARGEVKLVTSIVVFFEIFWVLNSVYDQSKSNICDILKKILKMGFVDIADRELLSTSLELYEAKNIEFEDCYNLVYSVEKQADNFVTFDKKLQKEVLK